ncbi:MAG: FtsW/RodA/SpoVE family cell cycle protein [Minisyncoccia bacterium]
MKKLKIDIPFAISVLILVIAGYLIFASASLGLLSKEPGKYANVAFSQTFLGLFLGSVACIFFKNLDYKLLRKYSLYLFIIALVATILVFVPSIGVSHGGAKRWIYIGSLSIQPSELLKVAYIIFLSAILSKFKDKAWTLKQGFLPFLGLTAIIGAVLLKQPDTDTFLIAAVSGISIYLSAGGRWRYVFLVGVIGLLGLASIAFMRPYVMSRITTFMNPEANSLGSGYQIQQSLIAIGSGGFFGRGFGQSIQKFNVLPEPIGDSIFAVAGEEFGFVGTITIILLFVIFSIRGLKIATRVPDQFGRLVVVGIVILIVSQAFVNIGSMVGVLPLSGITLPFVSHGGTALFMTLAEVGIILNISKNQRFI